MNEARAARTLAALGFVALIVSSRSPWFSAGALQSKVALGPADAGPVALLIALAAFVSFLALTAATKGMRSLAFPAVTIGVWLLTAVLVVYEMDAAAEELLAVFGRSDTLRVGLRRGPGLALAAAGSCLYVAAGILTLVRTGERPTVSSIRPPSEAPPPEPTPASTPQVELGDQLL